MWISKERRRNTRRLIVRLQTTADVYKTRYEQMQQLTKFLMDANPKNRNLVLPLEMTQGCTCGSPHYSGQRYDSLVKALPEDLKDIARLYYGDVITFTKDDGVMKEDDGG